MLYLEPSFGYAGFLFNLQIILLRELSLKCGTFRPTSSVFGNVRLISQCLSWVWEHSDNSLIRTGFAQKTPKIICCNISQNIKEFKINSNLIVLLTLFSHWFARKCPHPTKHWALVIRICLQKFQVFGCLFIDKQENLQAPAWWMVMVMQAVIQEMLHISHNVLHSSCYTWVVLNNILN